MSVSGTLRIAASRAAQSTAAIDDADRSTPTKMPRWVSEPDISFPCFCRIGSFTPDRKLFTTAVATTRCYSKTNVTSMLTR